MNAPFQRGLSPSRLVGGWHAQGPAQRNVRFSRNAEGTAEGPENALSTIFPSQRAFWGWAARTANNAALSKLTSSHHCSEPTAGDSPIMPCCPLSTSEAGCECACGEKTRLANSLLDVKGWDNDKGMGVGWEKKWIVLFSPDIFGQFQSPTFLSLSKQTNKKKS